MGWDHFIFYIKSQAYYSCGRPACLCCCAHSEGRAVSPRPPIFPHLRQNRVFLLALQPRVKKNRRAPKLRPENGALGEHVLH